MKRNNIRIAIQKDGRLKNGSLKLLASRGLKCDSVTNGKIIIPCPGSNIEVLFARQCDIPQYVQSGTADFGIVGSNILYENNFDVAVLEKLDFGKCSLVIAVPTDSDIKNVDDLEGERIATSYPKSLKKILNQRGVNMAIVKIAGSVEAAPNLGLADAICDITQTGNTLKANGLGVLATVLRSQAVFIESPFESEQKRLFKAKYGKETNLCSTISDQPRGES